MKQLTYLTYCYKFSDQEKSRYIRLYKESPSIFGYDLQRLGLKGFIDYISQEFVANCLYSIQQFTPEYIYNEHKDNKNTFLITRIIESDILGNEIATILKIQNKIKGVKPLVPI